MSLSQTLEPFGFSRNQQNLKLCISFSEIKQDFVENLPVLLTMETLFIIDVDEDLSMVVEFFEEVEGIFKLLRKPPMKNTKRVAVGSSRSSENALLASPAS